MEELNLTSIIAGILTIVAYMPYIVSIVRLETRPHLMTWSVWSILGVILTASYWAAGATLSALVVPILNVIGPIVIALFALKYGEYGYHFFDIGCFLVALAGLAGWAISGDPTFALYLCLMVDFSGSLPTIKKVALNPGSENRTAWVLFLLANSINLLTIPAMTFELMAYPLYLFGISLIITSLMLRQIWEPAPLSDRSSTS